MVPAQSIATPSPLTTGAIIVSGRGVLKGWGFRETTGAAVATLNVWDGTANNGLLIAPLSLASAGHEAIWLGELGVSFTRGLFVEVTAGSIVGALWVVPQEFATVDGMNFAYATAPATDGHPLLGIEE